MKKTLIATALSGACLLAAGGVSAGDTDAYFDGETGKLVVPQLRVGDGVFYVTLTLTDPVNFTFSTDISSFTDISVPDTVSETANTSADAIVGVWGFPGSTTTITFNSNGTYSQYQEPDAEEEGDCIDGGTETGTYTWSLETGILLANPQTDENGQCGLSDPREDVPLRVFVDGNTMTIIERGLDGGPNEQFNATLQNG